MEGEWNQSSSIVRLVPDLICHTRVLVYSFPESFQGALVWKDASGPRIWILLVNAGENLVWKKY